MAANVAAHALEASGISVHYGGVAALSDVSLRVDSGSVIGLIGPNGAGKTSFLNAVSGLAALSAGSIAFDGRPLHGHAPDRIARAGVVRTYQNVRLFRSLSVIENVRAGSFAARAPLDETRIGELMRLTGLHDTDPASRAASLAYGAQRRLEIARALASDPAIVLLDEPAAGLNPEETERLGALIRTIAQRGAGVLLVEHDMELVGSVCDRVAVLNFGSLIAQGTPSEVSRDESVIEAYLGRAG
jgi:branched-chain amino acid transport system ATP-binding protein